MTNTTRMTQRRLQEIEAELEDGVVIPANDIAGLVADIRRLQNHVTLLTHEAKMVVGRVKDSVAIDSVLPLSEQLIQCLTILKYLYNINDYQVAINSNTCRTTVRRISKGDMSASIVTLDKIMAAFPRHAIQLSVVEVDPEENGVDDEEITSD